MQTRACARGCTNTRVNSCRTRTPVTSRVSTRAPSHSCSLSHRWACRAHRGHTTRHVDTDALKCAGTQRHGAPPKSRAPTLPRARCRTARTTPEAPEVPPAPAHLPASDGHPVSPDPERVPSGPTPRLILAWGEGKEPRALHKGLPAPRGCEDSLTSWRTTVPCCREGGRRGQLSLSTRGTACLPFCSPLSGAHSCHLSGCPGPQARRTDSPFSTLSTRGPKGTPGQLPGQHTPRGGGRGRAGT